MDLTKTLDKINSGREKDEACFVFSLWSDPDLYADYMGLNEGTDETLKNTDARFYFQLGKAMYMNGYKAFDPITLETFLSDKKAAKQKFEERGGIGTVEELKNLVDPQNVDAYFDNICKRNSLSVIATKYDDMFEHVERFHNVSNEDVYDIFDGLNSFVSLSTGTTEKIEDLSVTPEYIQDCVDGNNMGFSYGKKAPLLNYITLGVPTASLFMIGGHSGTGKSSFTFSVILMGILAGDPNIKVGIISNEEGIKTYQNLLLSHILVNELHYWGLTRKAIKIGKFNEEQQEKIAEAMKISEEKYKPRIKFVKTFDNNIPKIIKYLRRLKTLGVSVVFYDTFKSDDSVDVGSIWQSLMLDARKLFQAASKLDIAVITSYQLALHTLNQRYLNVTALSNSKQIKEVYETELFFRQLWDDERPGEHYDVHPYKLNKENNKIHEEITLDPEKKYCLLFVDKTRSDETGQVLIYEWNARFNVWRELGFAKVINDHRIPG